MSITVNERSFDVQLPALDIREELVYEYGAKYKRKGVPLLRVFAAMVALCLPEVAFSLRVSAAGARADLAEFGGNVYIALKENGWTVGDIVTAGRQLAPLLVESAFPREREVETARGNSEAEGS